MMKGERAQSMKIARIKRNSEVILRELQLLQQLNMMIMMIMTTTTTTTMMMVIVLVAMI